MRNRLIALLVFITAGITLSAQLPELKNPSVEKIASGFNFVEGPLWVENLGLLFSDIPENKIYLLDSDSVVSTYITPSGKSNGLALDSSGNLIMCQHLARQIGKYENESIVTLASHYNGTRLNSPNDLTIKSTGSIFFTDPPFGLNDEVGTSELGYAGIYSITADGNVHLLDKTLTLPNGIAFSPDEKKLYVIDSEIADIYVWDVVNDSTLENKTLFYNMPTQWGDGMKTDSNGFLYVTAENGLTIFSAQGEIIENVHIGSSNSSNCGWGSLNGEPTMYVTSGNSVYRLRNKVVNTGFNITPESSQKNQINIYPNPAKGNVTFNLQNFSTKPIDIQVISINGKLIDNIAPVIFENTNHMTYASKKYGIFYLLVKTDKEFISKEFVLVE